VKRPKQLAVNSCTHLFLRPLFDEFDEYGGDECEGDECEGGGEDMYICRECVNQNENL